MSDAGFVVPAAPGVQCLVDLTGGHTFGEIDLDHALTEHHAVGVDVIESRCDGGATSVNDMRGSVNEGTELIVDSDDVAVPEADRPCARPGRVAGDDVGVGDECVQLHDW